MVVTQYPQLHSKTIQNILDQRRSLMVNMRITADRLNAIKHAVAVELGLLHDGEHELLEIDDTNNIPNIETEHTQVLNQIEEEFIRAYMLYEGLDPTLRPTIPKLKIMKGTLQIISKVNDVIGNKIKTETNLEQLHYLIYIGAYTVCTQNQQKINTSSNESNTKQKCEEYIPAWERRLTNKIKELRKQIGNLSQYIKEKPSPKVIKAGKKIIAQHKTEIVSSEVEILDVLKQKLAASAKRLRRYKISNERRNQNRQFLNKEKYFYRNLETTTNTVNPVAEAKAPSKDAIRQFWSNIWTTQVSHKSKRWITDEKKRVGTIKTMQSWEISKEEIQDAVSKTLNWKAPGIDKLQNFWYKRFTSTHAKLARTFTKLLACPEEMPQFMTQGITYLLPKTTHVSEDPSKYRPITCLPTVYKIFTSIIANKIYHHVDNNNLLDEEQKGCRKNSRGCKEQLIIDAVITGEAIKMKKSLYTAYIDYQKAFDSVPHTWLHEVLQMYHIEPHICQFLRYATTQWRTNLILAESNTRHDAGMISVKRGIFQGDSLSPLWFCLALRPLTSMLNNLHKGYSLHEGNTNISHLLYMDDLKLYAKTKAHLQDLLKCTEKFSDDIQMKFGLDKCKTSAMVKGKWVQHEGYEMNDGEEHIKGMESKDTYKYLGYQQARGIEQTTGKKELIAKYLKRVDLIFRSKLNAKNKSRAINTYATSVMTYGFGILKWTKTDLEQLNIKTRTLATKHRDHHPKSAIERFHLPRTEGGRGIPNLVKCNLNQIKNLRNYFHAKAKNSKLHNAIVKTDRNITSLNLSDYNFEPLDTYIDIKQKWKSKPLHGRYPTQIEQSHIDSQATNAWLTKSSLFSETEGFMIAIQDQVIATKYYRKHIIKSPDALNDKCRMCAEKFETIDHIISGCTVLAPKDYTERHNNVAKVIHQLICRNYNPEMELVPYYKYEPSKVIDNTDCKIYWNWQIITDRHIPNNIPDIVLEDKKSKMTYIIDVAIPLAVNIEKKHAEKISKYLPLADEIKQMWNQDRVVIIPIILGATGEIPKKLFTSLNEIKIKQNTYLLLQKIVILGTCRIVRRVLQD